MRRQLHRQKNKIKNPHTLFLVIFPLTTPVLSVLSASMASPSDSRMSSVVALWRKYRFNPWLLASHVFLRINSRCVESHQSCEEQENMVNANHFSYLAVVNGFVNSILERLRAGFYSDTRGNLRFPNAEQAT